MCIHLLYIVTHIHMEQRKENNLLRFISIRVLVNHGKANRTMQTVVEAATHVANAES